jgi:hypothetical protein
MYLSTEISLMVSCCYTLDIYKRVLSYLIRHYNFKNYLHASVVLYYPFILVAEFYLFLYHMKSMTLGKLQTSIDEIYEKCMRRISEFIV